MVQILQYIHKEQKNIQTVFVSEEFMGPGPRLNLSQKNAHEIYQDDEL